MTRASTVFFIVLTNLPMTFLAMCASSQDEKSKGVKYLIMGVYVAVLALAIFVAFKDIGMVPRTGTKIGIMLLALLFPELFLILTLISTSSMGVGFFSGTPIQSQMLGDYLTPSKMMKGAGKSMAAGMGLGMDSPSMSDSSSIF